MKSFFRPESIAVIGASPNRSKGGNAILRNVMRGFDGAIYPVNPNYDEIEGLPCYTSVAAIDKPVELVSIFVGANLVPQVLRECAAVGVKAAIIQSGGFAEAGEEGFVLQEECIAIGQEHGIRLWGPNCMGLMDANHNFVCSFLTPELWEDGLTPGGVSLITQSGTLAGAFIMDLMSHGTMGVAKACSIGNKMDVDECDLLEYLLEDTETSVIAMFLEGIPAGKGRKFLELAGRSNKPIVVLKGGRSEKGAAAAMSHTASLAGDDKIIRQALTQHGVILAEDFHQMMDISRALAAQPLAQAVGRNDKRGLAVLTFSGGAGILSADLLDKYQLNLTDLSATTLARLTDEFPAWATAGNPIDLWPLAEQIGGSEAYMKCARIAMEDEGVDALLLLSFTGGFNLDLDLAALSQLSKEKGKPIYFWIIGPQEPVKAFQQQVQAHGMNAYREISRAAEAIRAVFAKAQHQTSAGALSPLQASDSAITSVIETTTPLDGVLDEFYSKRVLKTAGIGTVPEAMAKDCDHALQLAEEIGYPIVLKGLIPGEVHKTEKNLVVLDLRNADDATRAYADLVERMEGAGSVVVQKFAKAELEFICGMVRDPDFGPTIMFGIGGVMAELYKDVVFRVAPLDQATALEMIDSIQAKAVLNGFRGRQPVDRQRLAETLIALSRIAVDAPQVSQIDINPLAVVDGKLMALDATLIVEEH